jgi:hypothetical protein
MVDRVIAVIGPGLEIDAYHRHAQRHCRLAWTKWNSGDYGEGRAAQVWRRGSQIITLTGVGAAGSTTGLAQVGGGRRSGQAFAKSSSQDRARAGGDGRRHTISIGKRTSSSR